MHQRRPFHSRVAKKTLGVYTPNIVSRDTLGPPSELSLEELSSSAHADRCVCHNLRMTSRAITRFYGETAGPGPLLGPQMSLLMVASHLPRPTIMHMAEQLSMDRTTVTRNLKPLEAKGLLRVEEGEDRREKLVRLTKSGETALTVMLERWEHVQRRVVEKLGVDRVNRLLADLAEVRRIAATAK